MFNIGPLYTLGVSTNWLCSLIFARHWKIELGCLAVSNLRVGLAIPTDFNLKNSTEIVLHVQKNGEIIIQLTGNAKALSFPILHAGCIYK